MTKQAITEEMGVQKDWAKEAKEMTLDKLPEFIRKLTEDYNHDYGTICHAIASCAIATANAVNRSSQGGITGFQAGAVMWEMINQWGVFGDGPKRILSYSDLLYPQSEEKFKEISRDTWEWAKGKANEFLASRDYASPAVRAHWEAVARGELPFGLRLAPQDPP